MDSDTRQEDAEAFVRALGDGFQTISERLTRLEREVFGDDSGNGDLGDGGGPHGGPGPLFDPGPATKLLLALGAELDDLRGHVGYLYTKMQVEVEEEETVS